MIRLAISVEGQTEEEFVKRVLAIHLRPRGMEPYPVLIGTGGGDVTVDRLAGDMARLYWSFDAVTSLVDYYGFRGKNEMSPSGLEERIKEAIGDRIDRRWDDSRVFPYVQQHEIRKPAVRRSSCIR